MLPSKEELERYKQEQQLHGRPSFVQDLAGDMPAEQPQQTAQPLPQDLLDKIKKAKETKKTKETPAVGNIIETIKKESPDGFVIDRIEDDTAVLLNRPDEQKQFYVPTNMLPEGVREGHILGPDMQINEEATKAAEERIKALLNKLQKD